VTTVPIKGFKDFLETRFQNVPVVEPVNELARIGKPSTERENVFIREFLGPAIREFFRGHGFTAEQVKEGLSVEGLANSPGFGRTPARKAKHLFTKENVTHSTPPKAWLRTSDERLTQCQACPDFAIRNSLLELSLLGEVKYLTSTSPRAAVRELYNASRQAVFYLGAFRGASDPTTYDSAMVILADASRKEALTEGRALLKEQLFSDRYGPETGIYFVHITLV